MAQNASLRIGVAGWSYPHWDSAVYPRPKARGFHPLQYLSRYVDTVEINSTFYRSIRPEVAQLWLSKVQDNPNFQFTAKLGRRFTHERALNPGEVAAFSEGLRPILSADKLGAVLMQFPWSFRFTEENRNFVIKLRRAFSRFPLVAEMRHSSWMREEALGMFIDYHVGFCNIDQPQRQSCMPPTACLTSSIGYVRLHGRGYGRWFQEFEERPRTEGRRDYMYSPEELAEWKERIDYIGRFAEKVYVVTANEEGGRSVVNALQMQALCGQAKDRVPRMLSRTYRRELENFRPDGPVQDALFDTVRAVA